MDLLLSPFGNIVNSDVARLTGCSLGGCLDAVYIPSLSNRNPPFTSINLLLDYAEEVVFVFTDSFAPWVDAIKDDQIRCEKIIELPNDQKQQLLFDFDNVIPSTRHRPSFDIPQKRNYALFDAKDRGYERILLIDDDLRLSRVDIENGINALFSGYSVAGAHVVDYPDCSTIDHIERIVTKRANIISMTGSCLFMNVSRVSGRFPCAYNEDLFFFMQQPCANSVVSIGPIFQLRYEPWRDLSRVKHEQFGDLIYDAFKKRFLGIVDTPIDWMYEIADRIKRVKMVLSCTECLLYRNALTAAIESILDIDIKSIVRFIEDCGFAFWVNKYFK